VSAIYEAIGRTVVRFVRVRYRRQIRIAAALAVASVLLGGFLAASRDVEEG
jgi:hypothetical protein